MKPGKIAQPIPKQALVFTCLHYKSFENTVGKKETVYNKQFLLFPQCFLPTWRTWTAFSLFHQISNSHLLTLSVWKSLKFVIQDSIKKFTQIKFTIRS